MQLTLTSKRAIPTPGAQITTVGDPEGIQAVGGPFCLALTGYPPRSMDPLTLAPKTPAFCVCCGMPARYRSELCVWCR